MVEALGVRSTLVQEGRRLVECRSQWPRLQVGDVGVSGNTASSRYLAW